MYRLFLEDEQVTPSDTPLLTGSYSYSAINNVLTIYGVAYQSSLKVGDFIKVGNSQQYKITGLNYDNNSGNYTVKTDYILTVSATTTIGTVSFYKSVVGKTDIAELDVEKVPFTLDYQSADLADISSRKDTISDSFTLKGTERNNRALGDLYHLNRAISTNIVNKLFFNYSPTRTVPCKLMQDSVLLVDGTFIVTNINVNNGAITYDCVITGKFLGLKNLLSDNELEDLDLNDLSHPYSLDSIINGYNGKVFYPFIDYGAKSSSDTINPFTQIPLNNFRPALTVSECISRIFSAYDLKCGFKGTADELARYNRLIIPYTDDVLGIVYREQTIGSATIPNTNTIHNTPYWVFARASYDSYAVPTFTINNLNSHIVGYKATPLKPNGEDVASNCLQVLQTVQNIDLRATFSTLKYYDNNFGNASYKIAFQIVSRNKVDDKDIGSTWTVIAETTTDVLSYDDMVNAMDNKTFTVNATGVTLIAGQLLTLRVFVYRTLPNTTTYPDLYVTNVTFNIPTNLSDGFVATPNLGDSIIPRLPEDIKQVDFLKSFMQLNNMFLDNDKNDPDQYWLQSFDYYYSGFKNLQQNAKNWTEKIDLSQAIKMNSNIDLPKNYVFTFKEDTDYLNDDYKDNYDRVYGDFEFNDSLGTSDAKKIELIFSPIVDTMNGAQGRLFPYFVKGGLNYENKTATKVNIRLAYYNPSLPCSSYTIINDVLQSDGTIDIQQLQTFPTYNEASNYYRDSTGKPIASLLFGQSLFYYFSAIGSVDYINLPTSYSLGYINNISELIDPNLITIEVSGFLTITDIANLDLKLPVFIDLLGVGATYFKILKLSFTDEDSRATLTLQKVL